MYKRQVSFHEQEQTINEIKQRIKEQKKKACQKMQQVREHAEKQEIQLEEIDLDQ